MVLEWTIPNVAGDSSIEDIVSERVKEKFQRSMHDSKHRSAEGSLGEARTSQFDIEGRVCDGGDGDVQPRHRISSQVRDAESSETDMPNSTTSSIRGSCSTDVWTSSSDHSANESETENEDSRSQRSTATSGSTEEEWSYYVEAAESKVKPEPGDREDVDMEEDIVVDDFRWMIRNVRMTQPETIVEEMEQTDTASTVSSQLKLGERFTEAKHEQMEEDQDSPRTVIRARDQVETILDLPARDADIAVESHHVGDNVVGDEGDTDAASRKNVVIQRPHNTPEFFETPTNIETMETTERSSLQMEQQGNGVSYAKKSYTLESHTEIKVSTRRRRRRRNINSSQIATVMPENSSSMSGDSFCSQTGDTLHEQSIGSGDSLRCNVQQKTTLLQPDERGDHARETLFESKYSEKKVRCFDTFTTSQAPTHCHSLLRHLSLEELSASSDKLKKDSSTDTKDYLSPEKSTGKYIRNKKRSHSAPAKLSEKHLNIIGTALSDRNENADLGRSKFVSAQSYAVGTTSEIKETQGLNVSDVNAKHISQSIKATEQETVMLTSTPGPLKMASLQETLHMYLESQTGTTGSTKDVSPPVESQPSPTRKISPSESLHLPVNFAAYREVTPEEKCIAYALATSQLDSSIDRYKDTCSVPDGQARLEWVITEGTPFQINKMMSGAAQVFGESPSLPFLVESSTDKLKSATFDTDYDSVSSVSSFSNSTSSAESVRERSNTDLSTYSDPSDNRNEAPVDVSRVPSYLSFGSPSAAIAVNSQRQNLYEATTTCFSAAFVPKASRHSASDEDLYPSFISAGISNKGPRVSRTAVRKVKRTRSFSPVSSLGKSCSRDAVRRRIMGPNVSGVRPKSADCDALLPLDPDDMSSKSDPQK